MRSRLWDLPAEIIEEIMRLIHRVTRPQLTATQRTGWATNHYAWRERMWSGPRRRYSDGTIAFKPHTDQRLVTQRTILRMRQMGMQAWIDRFLETGVAWNA